MKDLKRRWDDIQAWSKRTRAQAKERAEAKEMSPIVIREYKSMDAYQRDAVKLAAQGYTVTAVTDRQQRAGVGRMASPSPSSPWSGKPKPKLLVTYSKEHYGANL
jgi:hypothetical protein